MKIRLLHTFNINKATLFSLVIIGFFLPTPGLVGTALAGKPDCTIEPPHPSCKDDGGDGGGADLNALTRARMTDWTLGNGGISSDGVDGCESYDYWSHSDTGLIPPCNLYEIRSDTSGGGRWFLRLPRNGEIPEIRRWLLFDFSNATGGSVCPDFEGDLTPDPNDSIYSSTEMNPAHTDPDPCVDNLGVWVAADRALKKKATRQAMGIRFWSRGVEFAFVEYINPLYLRKPILDHDPLEYVEADCRLLTTRPGPDDTDGDVSEAELREWTGVFTGPLIGTYKLPFEVCLIRASDDN